MKSQIQTLKEEDTSDLEGAVTEGVTASVSLPTMRKTLNSALIKGAQQALSELTDHQEELQLLNHVYSTDGAVKPENIEIVTDLAKEAIDEVNVTVANVHKLMSAFIKYAKGTEVLVKKANEETKMQKKATECEDKKEEEKKEKEEAKEEAKKEKEEEKEEKEKEEAKKEKEEKKEKKEDEDDASDIGCDDDLDALLAELTSEEEQEEETLGELGSELDLGSEDLGDIDMTIKDGVLEAKNITPEELGKLNASKDISALRAKVAQKGVAFSDMLQKAHPSGGFTTKLDTKPTGDLAKVETLPEQHKRMMEVAEAPPRVRKAAEDIQRLVTAGKIDPASDFPALISEGLDPAAVAYWKKFWGEAKDAEASKFVNDLVKGYQAKKAEEEMTQYRVKVSRSYELAHEMAKRGMIGETREAVSKEAERLMKMADDNFEYMKDTVDRFPMKKTASIPNVGVEESIMGSSLVVPAVQTDAQDLTKKFEAAFRGKKY
jgi:hypothetical protein